jgi:hypothetical protein
MSKVLLWSTAFMGLALTDAKGSCLHSVLSQFSAYPDYAGGEFDSVTGRVDMQFKKNKVTFTYNLDGVDPDCAELGADPDTPNSCGIHFHAGTSCDTGDDVKGHYWNSDELDEDPWTYGASYGSSGTKTVTYKISGEETVGRAFVLHDREGNRITCDLVPPLAATVATTSLTGKFTPYPGYGDDTSEDLVVTGDVQMKFTSTDTVLFMYNLQGADPDCAELGPDPETPNSCGIHFHAGTSCDTGDDVKGHYWNSDVLAYDPWTYEAAYTGSEGSVRVTSGFSAETVVGRSFVLHDRSGTRITCDTVPELDVVASTVISGDLSAYPGYTPGFEPRGVVDIDFTADSSVLFTYDLDDVDPDCADGPDPEVANSCGIHFHAGTSCDTGDDVKGHYWMSSSSLTADPWTYGAYYTEASGQTLVHYGYGADATVGHTFVLHDKSGARISCDLVPALDGLAGKSVLTTFGIYPDYDGEFDDISGIVDMEFYSTGGVVFTYDLDGVDPACATDGPIEGKANSCGIHFHAGESCDTGAEVEGHFFGDLEEDPWTFGAFYTEAAGSTFVYYKESFEDTIGRAFVLHDRDGNRIACQLVPKAELEIGRTTIDTLSPYPGYDVDSGFEPKGTIDITYFDSGAVEFSYYLKDVDPDCAYGADPLTANSCGIHFHAGESCDTGDDVEGHYWNSEELVNDPWTYGASYFPTDGNDKDDDCDSDGDDKDDDDDNNSRRRRLLDHDDDDDADDVCDKDDDKHADDYLGERVVYRFSAESTVGRAFVLHDRSGTRVTCDIVPDFTTAASVTLTEFPVYPDYTDELDDVTGTVTLNYLSDNAVMFVYDLDGVDPDCADGAGDAANSCGIHIHAGTSCDTAGEVGGHYWNSDKLDEDPWTYGAPYTTARGSTFVVHGYSAAESAGHVFVLHDKNGDRIVCAPLPLFTDATCVRSKLNGDLTPYPGYGGSLAVSGKVDMNFQASGQVQFKYDLDGVDPDCEEFGADPEVANSCGIHFHAGTSCDTGDDVKGHYWNDAQLDEDPWTYGAYYTQGKDKESVFYGHGSQSTIGRAFVLHDRSGGRITCDIVPNFELYYPVSVSVVFTDISVTSSSRSEFELMAGEYVEEFFSLYCFEAFGYDCEPDFTSELTSTTTTVSFTNGNFVIEGFVNLATQSAVDTLTDQWQALWDYAESEFTYVDFMSSVQTGDSPGVSIVIDSAPTVGLSAVVAAALIIRV